MDTNAQPPADRTDPPVATPGAAPAVCYRHPARPTRLGCSACGRPICVDCANPAAVGQKCDECARPVGRNRVIRANEIRGEGMLSGAPVVATILGITVAIAALNLLMPSLWREIAIPLIDDVRLVAQGQWYRTITAALLHSPGLLHVGFNMWALAVFGPQIERRAGRVPFLVLYLATAAAGGAAFQATQDVGSAVGASGAIFGLFGVHLTAAYLARNTLAGRAGLRQLLPLLGLNLALPLLVPNIAWEAHIGGLVAGALIMFGWSRFAPLGRDGQVTGGPSAQVRRTLIAVVVLVASILVLPLL